MFKSTWNQSNLDEYKVQGHSSVVSCNEGFSLFPSCFMLFTSWEYHVVPSFSCLGQVVKALAEQSENAADYAADWVISDWICGSFQSTLGKTGLIVRCLESWFGYHWYFLHGTSIYENGWTWPYRLMVMVMLFSYSWVGLICFNAPELFWQSLLTSVGSFWSEL